MSSSWTMLPLARIPSADAECTSSPERARMPPIDTPPTTVQMGRPSTLGARGLFGVRATTLGAATNALVAGDCASAIALFGVHAVTLGAATGVVAAGDGAFAFGSSGVLSAALETATREVGAGDETIASDSNLTLSTLAMVAASSCKACSSLESARVSEARPESVVMPTPPVAARSGMSNPALESPRTSKARPVSVVMLTQPASGPAPRNFR
mmetsp:Transcript_100529/g.307219  ORF Transcript_100529/g.307219 Transcript_100529/m.307219 type:complete len:212 (-) Transcript_100529:16-651(-)